MGKVTALPNSSCLHGQDLLIAAVDLNSSGAALVGTVPVVDGNFADAVGQ